MRRRRNYAGPIHLPFKDRYLQSVNEPAKALYRLLTVAESPLLYVYLRAAGANHSGHIRSFGLPVIRRFRGSTIQFGRHVELRNWRYSNPVGLHHRCYFVTTTLAARIVVGNGCGLSGATLCAATEIVLGPRTMLGANSTVLDTDLHPLALAERRFGKIGVATAPVHIGERVFVGAYALILKGVTIGDGAVIGAASVVTKDVPSMAVAAGNPARIVGYVDRMGRHLDGPRMPAPNGEVKRRSSGTPRR